MKNKHYTEEEFGEALHQARMNEIERIRTILNYILNVNSMRNHDEIDGKRLMEDLEDFENYLYER